MMAHVAMTLALAGCADWTARDTALASIAVAGGAVDLYQTATRIAPACQEADPLIGRCGTMRAGVVIPVGQLAALSIAAALPPRWRGPWLGVWGATEWATVWSNHVNGY